MKVWHGAPLPLSAGNVQVCVHNTFSEDVVGTTNLANGSGAVRIRQNSKTYLGGNPAEPCPVCGGFCSGLATATDPLHRLPCTTNADCLDPPHVCVTDHVCSYGENMDGPCRPDPPFGGPTSLFGNPSVDCPFVNTVPIGQPNILFNPAMTGMVMLTATLPCTAAGFTGKACLHGANDGRPCTMATDCPGGDCQHQCFCPAQERPNDCSPACLGGANDGAACDVNSECPGGFCHAADCRLNPLDLDSSQEGICTVGPADQHCRFATYHACTGDADCQPSEDCPLCQVGEQCLSQLRQCFVNPIQRSGMPGTPDRVGVAVFCVPATGSVVDGVAGLAGPGAITQPETSLYTGF